ncbi:phage tail length tape measure family protein [Methylobacterium aquaticum]|uniref:Bacteriophage tail tape measure N-terminal domain-containing protein n=1 Tax=Methylobacterium aquaticum TaxID=270351 RepID=A0A0J6T1Z5_9HYPH|nr:phage tail length tape measure family protein [Methylobacterium aquaticum]KMO39613.1 hypothetical protein VP06_03855 [Methylobacterium aquaticum]
MTLQLAVRITGDASSLQQSAVAASAAVKSVGAASASATAEMAALGRAADTTQTSVEAVAASAGRVRDASGRFVGGGAAGAAPPGAQAMPSAGPVVPPRSPQAAGAPVNDNGGRPTLRADQWKNLGFQANDIATSFAGGLPITQILAQQGGQVVQVLADAPGGVAGGLKAVATRAMEILTPVRLVTAGFVGLAGTLAYLGVSWTRSQDEIKTGLMGIGAMSRATVADINRIAEASAAGGRIGRGDARDVAAQIAATGRVDVSQIQGVTDLAPGLAKLTGKSIRDAGGDLAKMFADPIKGAQALNEIVGGLNAGTQNYIRTLIEQGSRQEAVRQIVLAFGPDLEKAAEKTSLWGRAWEWVANQAERAGAAVARPFMPTTAQQRLDKAREDLNQLRGAQTQPSPTTGLFGGLTQDQMRLRAARAAPQNGEAIKAKEAEIRKEEELAEREKRTAEASAARKLAAERSQTAEAAVRATQPEIGALEQLETRYKTLKAAQGDLDALSGMSAAARGQLTDAVAAAEGGLKTFMSAQERARASESLTIRSIEARTAAEKAAVAAERERLALAGQAISEDDRRQRIEAARQAVLAQTNRDSQDRLRTANDNAASAGLLPYQRQQADLEAKYRRQNREDQGSPEALANNRAAQAAERRAIDAEAIGGPLRDANRGLAEQVAALRNQQLAFGASTEAAARMAAAQELINRYTAQGVPVTADLKRGIDAYAASAGKVAAAQEDLLRRQREVIGGLDDVRGGIRGGLTGIFSDVSQGKNPLDGITSSISGLASRVFDRTVSGPLVNTLLGQDGKAGGGLFGDGIASIFGKAAGLPSADITAGIVNVTGPVSGIPGLTAANGNAPSAASVATGLTGGASSDLERYAKAIRTVESGSAAGRYDALGPITKSGDRAYGAYQVMGSNIPSWTKDALGKSMSPQEFLGDKAAQDAVFAKQFGASVSKYGNANDAASVWFTGRPLAQGGAARDVLGTTGNGYVDKFNAALPPAAPAATAAAPVATGLDASLQQVNTSAQAASQGVASLGTDLAALPGPLTQTSQGLTQVGNSLGGSGGGGLLGMLSSLFGGGGAAGAPAATVAAATGGHIRGPGTGTSDSILARVSNGEFVMNAAATARNLPLLHALNDNRLPMFAEGGLVGMPAPVMARRDEVERRGAVGDAAAAPAGPPEFHIHDNVGVSKTTKTSKTERGGTRIDTYLDEAVAGLMEKPGSRTGRMMQSGWGLSRSLVKR